MKPLLTSLSALIAGSVVSQGATILEDFESYSGGTPSNFTAVSVNASVANALATAGGNGGGTGVSLTSGAPATGSFNNLPGYYLRHSEVFDINVSFSGSFDFNVTNTASGYNDLSFMFGDLDGSYGTANELLGAKLSELGSVLTNGINAPLGAIQNITAGSYDTANFTWTASGLNDNSGTFTIDHGGPSTSTAFTFGSSDAQFAFGSVNDTVAYDNINIVSVPEPSSTALLGLAGLGLVLRRRR